MVRELRKVVIKRKQQEHYSFRCNVCNETKSDDGTNENYIFKVCKDCNENFCEDVTCDCCKNFVSRTELANDKDGRYYYEMGLYYNICKDCVTELNRTPEVCGKRDKDGNICDNYCCDGYEYCSDCLEIEIFG